MHYFLYILLLVLLSACNNNASEKSMKSSTETPTMVQETSPTARFQHFAEKFPTIKLPYVLGDLNSFDRMEDEFIEHILKAKNNRGLGLDKSANCIATFKVGSNIAVVYQWMLRPAPINAAMQYKLAIFTPYGAPKGSIFLGVNQNREEEFQETLNFRISANFTVTTEHHLEYYVAIESDEGRPDYAVYPAFYTNQYQIRQDGSVEQLKKANLWEKVPYQFTAPFVESFKKEPQHTEVEETIENGRVILRTTDPAFSQVIFAQIEGENDRECLLVSSMTTERSEVGDSATINKHLVHSKFSILEFQGRQLSIKTNKMIDKSQWPGLYAIFKDTCACVPSPNVNDQGIIALTSVGTPMLEAIYGDLGRDGQVEFKCFNPKDKEHRTIHKIKLDKKVEYEG